MTTRDATLKYSLATKGQNQNRVVLSTGFQVFYALLEDAHRQGLTPQSHVSCPPLDVYLRGPGGAALE